MNELVDYKSKEPGAIMKFLWNCAGADAQILKYSSHSDHVKYAGIGGVVLATGVLAALSMGFAMHTIFESWYVTVPVSLVWALIVFNLDRFIVSSTGKGDGKDSISWSEFGNAIPRLLMAILLGLTISAPLETFIFKNEIEREWKLSMDKLALAKKYEIQQEEDSKNAQNEKNLSEKKSQVEVQRKIYEDAKLVFNKEMDGGAGTRGYGTEAKIKEGKMKDEEAKLLVLETEMKALENKKIGNEDKIKAKQDSAVAKIKNEKPGFLDEIMMLEKLSAHGKEVEKYNAVTNSIEETKDPKTGKTVAAKEEIYGAAFWPIWLVRLLFMIIEIAPVILKLMLIKSPYDYMSDNVNQILEAKQGISLEHRKDEDNKLNLVKENYNPKRIVEVVKHQNELEAENAKLAISLYAETEKENIKNNPSDFIKEDNKS
jgi:hypothetical protein